MATACDGHATPDATSAPDKPRAPDPAAVASASMVRRFLETNPGAAHAARREGSVCVVEVTAPSWVAPVAEAWRSLALGPMAPCSTNGAPKDGKKAGEAWPVRSAHPDDEEPDDAPVVQFLRDGGDQSQRSSRTRDQERLHRAVARGRHVMAVSHDPVRWLPKELLRAADVSARIPPLDATSLGDAVQNVTGHLPSRQPAHQDLAQVTADDLRLARRPGDDADVYLGRILRMAGQRPGSASSAPTLPELHGMDEAVAWGLRLARDLADYKRGAIGWAQVDRGLLLSGPPGVGKTQYVRALATTCGVPLVASSLSAWQASDEAHLGHMLRAMRGSFAQARATAPSILFIDEIDGIGDRGNLVMHDRDYWMLVVNALLELLDGMQDREGVVVLGACNHPHRIDPGILRSGRLDRHIEVGIPDAGALARILRFHLGADLPETDLARIASLGLGGTGADVERWVRSARQTARHADRPLAEEDLVVAVRGSPDLPSPGTLRRVSVHEAGHALLAELQRPGSVVKVDIHQHPERGGGTLAMEPAEDRRLLSRGEAEACLRLFLAGRAAEEILLGEPSSGAGGGIGSDLARATLLATAMLGSFGLGSDAGEARLFWCTPPNDQTSLQAMLALCPGLTETVSSLLAKEYSKTKALLSRHAATLARLAARLAEDQVLTGAQVREVVSAAPEPSSAASSTPKGSTWAPEGIKP